MLRLEIERLNVEAKELRSQIQHNPALIELTLKMISLEDTLGNLREKCKRNGKRVMTFYTLYVEYDVWCIICGV